MFETNKSNMFHGIVYWRENDFFFLMPLRVENVVKQTNEQHKIID